MKYLQSNAKFNLSVSAMIYSVLAFIELCRYGIIIYAIYLVSNGKMEIGTVLLIYSYYAKIITNFEVLGTINAEYQSFKVSLNRLNKSVPEDVSVIGFDNIRTGEFMSPKLSTFNIPRQEIGEEVAKYVANSLKSHQIAYSQIVIRCNYIERESNRVINKE